MSSKRPIKLGKNTNSGYVVVTEGVKEGEPVVKTGIQNLKLNSTIKILPPQQPQTNSSDSASDSAQQNNGENQ